MAFTLNSFVAYGVEAEEPLNNRYRQIAILNISAANTDVDLDIGDYAGTFWAAVDGSEPGDTALQAIKDIQTLAESFLGAKGTAMAPRLQVLTSAGSANQYVLAMNGTNAQLPDITFHSGSAPTANILVLEWVLKANQEPVEVSV